MGPREVIEETRALETRDREIRESSQLAFAGLAAAAVGHTQPREPHPEPRAPTRHAQPREPHPEPRAPARHAPYTVATRRRPRPAPSDEPPVAGLDLQRHPKHGPVSPNLLRLIEEAGSSSHDSPIPRLALRGDAEAAAAIGVSVDYFAEYIAAEIPCVRRGRLKLYAVPAVAAWLQQNAERTIGGAA